MRKIDISGERFGRLLVLKEEKSSCGHRRWLCQCDCGNKKIISQTDLRTGKSTSCGCYHNERLSEISRKHGETHTRLYRIWRGMINRCENKKDKAFEWYGARGIEVCDEWRKDFTQFRDWANKNGYKENLTIDRIDTNKNYEPNNCRWITASENSARVVHIKSARFLEVDGKSKNESQWAREIGVSQPIIHSWIKKYGEDGAIEKIRNALLETNSV